MIKKKNMKGSFTDGQFSEFGGANSIMNKSVNRNIKQTKPTNQPVNSYLETFQPHEAMVSMTSKNTDHFRGDHQYVGPGSHPAQKKMFNGSSTHANYLKEIAEKQL
jgi:hypothetical protein